MNGECMVESKIVNLVLQRDYEICTWTDCCDMSVAWFSAEFNASRNLSKVKTRFPYLEILNMTKSHRSIIHCMSITTLAWKYVIVPGFILWSWALCKKTVRWETGEKPSGSRKEKSYKKAFGDQRYVKSNVSSFCSKWFCKMAHGISNSRWKTVKSKQESSLHL